MIDPYVLLAPILLLGIVAVLGFVGCSFRHGGEPKYMSVSPSSGPGFGGTAVTITGEYTDWTSVQGVTFGSSPATMVNLVGDQTVMATTPAYADPAEGDVQVAVSVSYIGSDGKSSTDSSDSASTPSYFTYFPPVTHLETKVQISNTNVSTIQAPPLTLQGNELIVATLLWGGAGAPTVAGANFQAFPPETPPFAWDNRHVQTFWAINTVHGDVTVAATFSLASPVRCSLCVSAYDHADTTRPIDTAVWGDPSYVGTTPETINPLAPFNVGDLIYSVAFAADSDGSFPGLSGTNHFQPGPGFTAESGAVSDPLVQDQQVTALTAIKPKATNTTSNLNPKGWIFAMTIKVSLPSS